MITTVDDVLKNFDNLFLYDQYYERPNFINRLFGHWHPDRVAVEDFRLKDLSSELKEEVKAHLLFLEQHSTGHATQPNAAYVLRVLGYPPDDDSMGTPVFSY